MSQEDHKYVVLQNALNNKKYYLPSINVTKWKNDNPAIKDICMNDDGSVLLGYGSGLIRSTDGENWEVLELPYPLNYINSMVYYDGKFVLQTLNYVFVSEDDGISWLKAETNPDLEFLKLEIHNNLLLRHTIKDGYCTHISYSSDGYQWTDKDLSDYPILQTIYKPIVVSGNGEIGFFANQCINNNQYVILSSYARWRVFATKDLNTFTDVSDKMLLSVGYNSSYNDYNRSRIVSIIFTNNSFFIFSNPSDSRTSSSRFDYYFAYYYTNSLYSNSARAERVVLSGTYSDQSYMITYASAIGNYIYILLVGNSSSSTKYITALNTITKALTTRVTTPYHYYNYAFQHKDYVVLTNTDSNWAYSKIDQLSFTGITGIPQSYSKYVESLDKVISLYSYNASSISDKSSSKITTYSSLSLTDKVEAYSIKNNYPIYLGSYNTTTANHYNVINDRIYASTYYSTNGKEFNSYISSNYTNAHGINYLNNKYIVYTEYNYHISNDGISNFKTYIAKCIPANTSSEQYLYSMRPFVYKDGNYFTLSSYTSSNMNYNIFYTSNIEPVGDTTIKCNGIYIPSFKPFIHSLFMHNDYIYRLDSINNNSYYLHRSKDGFVWDTISNINYYNDMYSTLMIKDGKFYLIGGQNSQYTHTSIDNGETWQSHRITIDGVESTLRTYMVIYNKMFICASYIAAANQSKVYTSMDGIHWQSHPIACNGYIYGLVYANLPDNDFDDMIMFTSEGLFYPKPRKPLAPSTDIDQEEEEVTEA